jgi:hypothetical protein
MADGIEGLGDIVEPLGKEEAAQLSESVRFRIVKGNAKGRPFGTPRNPRVPTADTKVRASGQNPERGA